MIKEGSILATPSLQKKGDVDDQKWVVLRRLPSADGAVLLVARISSDVPPSAAVAIPLRGKPPFAGTSSSAAPCFVRFDQLMTLDEDEAGMPVDALAPKILRDVRAAWRTLAFSEESPETTSSLPFALPELGIDEIANVMDTLSSGWLTTGPKARKFETAFAAYVGSEHALAVNSCTAGLHLALEAIGIGPGDMVITTPYTFTATAEVIRYLGADPLFVDIDPRTFNIDANAVAAALKSHGKSVKAIMPVHFAGQACDMDPIFALAESHGLKVIEDAAHALPTTYKGRLVGTLGDATVFSFYATKTITTGEGGMVTTDDAEIAERIATMRLHGIDRDVFDRYTSDKPAWYYEVVAPGFKYNMPDIAAAIGIEQLRKADDLCRRRKEIANAYTKAFKDLPLTVPYVARPEDTHAWHLYVIKPEIDRLEIDRDRFIELMAEAGIGTSVHFIPLHLHPYWRDRYRLRPDDFPIALDLYNRAVSLPIYTRMSDTDVRRVIEAVRSILRRAVR